MKFLGITISVDIKDRRAQLIIAIGVSIGIAVFLGAAGFALMLKGINAKDGKAKEVPVMEESSDFPQEESSDELKPTLSP